MRAPPLPPAAPRRPAPSRLTTTLQALVQVGTLLFWAPVLGFDVLRLRAGGWTPDALLGVFWLLYREAIVFLAVWAFMAVVQAGVLLFAKPGRPARLTAPP